MRLAAALLRRGLPLPAALRLDSTATPNKNIQEPVASYKEVRIGKTLYRVTSVFSGEKDLGRTLEQLAVRCAMTELDAPATAQPCHAS